MAYVLLAFSAAFAISVAVHGWKLSRGKRLVSLLSCIFLLVGTWSFLGASAAATGALPWIPNSFEWPVGWSSGVATTTDGLYVVPHEPAGRVQLYDQNLRFVRGWQVGAFGGSFKVASGSDGRIEVHTARQDMLYVFDSTGRLLSSTKNPPQDFGSVPQGRSMTIPTPWWGWPLVSPAFDMPVVLAGMLLALPAFVEAKQRRLERSRSR